MSGTQANSEQDFSIGIDTRIVLIFDAPIGRVELRHKVGFTCRQITHEVSVNRLSGTPLFTDIPAGWQGDLTLERGDPSADQLASIFETMYYSGLRIPKGQIYQYINEPDGSRSTFVLEGASLNLTDAGTWRANTAVPQTIKYRASRRRPV